MSGLIDWWRLVVRWAPLALAGLSLAGAVAFSVAINAPTRLPDDVDIDTAAPVDAAGDAALAGAPTRAPRAGCVSDDVALQAASVLFIGAGGATDASSRVVAELRDVGVGGVVLNDTNIRDYKQAEDLIEGLRARLGDELVVALDEEGGRVTSLGRIHATGPSARRLGRLPAPDIEGAGEDLGAVADRLGVDLVLGPVADLDDGPAGGVIGDRSFGPDPRRVGEAARRFAVGVRSRGVGVVAKHFPGYAGGEDSHAGPASSDVTLTDLMSRNVAAFRPLLAEGVEAVMVGHVAYEPLGPLPASLNPAAYRLLREEGFTGPAMTDALGMGAINRRWPFDRAAVAAVAAGADVLLANQAAAARPMRDAIVAAVASGSLSADRLREAATRAATLRSDCASPTVVDQAPGHRRGGASAVKDY